MSNQQSQWVIEPLVPDEIYTDRAEFIDYFYQAALDAARRRTVSTVLLGRRRMGKTEIFKRVVNRLFFDQEQSDPQAVVPVYFSFPDFPEDKLTFGVKYLENLMRYYVAFYTGQPEGVRRGFGGEELLSWIEQSRALYPFTEMLDTLLRWHHSMRRGDMMSPEQEALEIPRRVAAIDNSTIVVFLDEFQNTRLPHFDFDIVGYVKEAVESLSCPHFVTGSAMSILAREIIGRGSLFGRFDSKPIEPLSQYWGAQLALNVARYYETPLSDWMAVMVAERCGGSPFYISAVVRRAALIHRPLIDEESINSVLAVDISSGFIWAELYEQVQSWIERLNDFGITKWILYLSAVEEDERISLERIQQELSTKEGQEISLEKIRSVLVRLSRGDLIEYLELGDWFRKIDDPILLEFLRVWGRVEIEGQDQNRVRDELVNRYQSLNRRFYEYQGYLAEVFMAQVLFNSQNQSKQPLPGRFFSSEEDIVMGWPLSYVNHRVRLKSGQGQEIDLLAAIGTEKWVCQSKWVTSRKIGTATLTELLNQAAAVEKEFEQQSVRVWLFAHEGLTQEAEELAREKNILWSNREQFDELLSYLDLRKLPEL
ncbi:hypothetical protein KFU94_22245 [Chloroflexi bacterium TSY]|nr:hypothetical protein [Chloroflexi bacterium TSY]